MSLITKVKAGSVSSLSDARYFAGMGVDWLGFDVNPESPSYVSLELYRSMAGWVSGPKRVIEIHGHVDSANLDRIVTEFQPDAIEVDWDQLSKLPHDIIAMGRANLPGLDVDLLASFSRQIEYLVLHTEGNPFNAIKTLQALAGQVKILLSIRPDFQDCKKAIQELPIAGIALTGSREEKVGIKSYDYSEILELLDDES